MAITTIAPAARKSTVRTTRRPVTAARPMAAPAKRAKRAPRDFETRMDTMQETTTTAPNAAGTTRRCVIFMIRRQSLADGGAASCQASARMNPPNGATMAA